jgi:hypothetical protein
LRQLRHGAGHRNDRGAWRLAARGRSRGRPKACSTRSPGRIAAVAHALLRAVSRLFSTRLGSCYTASKQGVGTSADAARRVRAPRAQLGCRRENRYLVPVFTRKLLILGNKTGT